MLSACWPINCCSSPPTNLMAAGVLQALRRAVVAFLAVVFAVGLLTGGTLGFFLGRAAGRRG
jgi:membrane protein DedA with SNARE-associated domain